MYIFQLHNYIIHIKLHFYRIVHLYLHDSESTLAVVISRRNPGVSEEWEDIVPILSKPLLQSGKLFAEFGYILIKESVQPAEPRTDVYDSLSIAVSCIDGIPYYRGEFARPELFRIQVRQVLKLP